MGLIIKKSNQKFKAFIFDMDGVIVDSMPYHFISWYEALQPVGVRVSCLDIYLREGEKWEKSLCDFFKMAKIKPTKKILEKVFLAHERSFRKVFKRVIFNGVEDLLLYLKKKGKIALVTGTSAFRVGHILPTKINKLFDYKITGDKVKQGKPHPESYLKAAEKLGVKPSECVVIENAPNGILSAKRAGMYCIAVTTSLPKQYLKKADIVVGDIKDVKEKIINVCKR